MMKIEFHPNAQIELAEAVEFYDSCAEGLGDQFIKEVEENIFRIEAFPLAWPQLSPNSRRCRLSRFPYGVIYQMTETTIYIVAVMHTHRKPFYWRDRVE